MQPTSFWDLVGFLMFVTLVSGERIKKDKEKAGICPADNRLCFIFDYPRCQRDNQCEGNKKCCFMKCGFRCVIPQKPLKKENPGQILDQDSGTGRIRSRSQNQYPIKVQRKVKRKAKGKHRASKNIPKSGVCPVNEIKCTKVNPPKLCYIDTDCPGAKKCCEGYCGMTCLEPQ